MLVGRLAEAIESDEPRLSPNHVGYPVDNRGAGGEAVGHTIIPSIRLDSHSDSLAGHSRS